MHLDTAFTELERDEEGRAWITVEAPDGRGARLWMDRSFPHAQIFSGDTLPPERRRRALAIEPMTCPADAFRSGTDLIVLSPGQTWRGAWGISPVGG